MSEQQTGDVQDPAEPYQDDQEVETSDQPDDGDDESEDQVTTGGEGTFSSGDPVETPAVEVSPATVPDDTRAKRDNVHGKDYEVTPEGGYRRV